MPSRGCCSRVISSSSLPYGNTTGKWQFRHHAGLLLHTRDALYTACNSSCILFQWETWYASHDLDVGSISSDYFRISLLVFFPRDWRANILLCIISDEVIAFLGTTPTHSQGVHDHQRTVFTSMDRPSLLHRFPTHDSRFLF